MICPYCDATVLSTSQPIKEATAAQHFDLRKGEPARFVRNGILETCQCTDCAALAATPAVGGEREALLERLKDRADPYAGSNSDHELIQEAVDEIERLAAPPASPLRARDDLIPAGKQAKFKHAAGDWFGVFDWHDNPESFEYRTVYALSASPPAQPALPNKDPSK